MLICQNCQVCEHKPLVLRKKPLLMNCRNMLRHSSENNCTWSASPVPTHLTVVLRQRPGKCHCSGILSQSLEVQGLCEPEVLSFETFLVFFFPSHDSVQLLLNKHNFQGRKCPKMMISVVLIIHLVLDVLPACFTLCP